VSRPRTIARRTLLVGMAAAAGALALPRGAVAMGRTPLGGRVELHVPWALGSIDPHDLRDPAAALFASAIADPIFALDAAGNPYPTLAAAMPAAESVGTVVRLREGLRTARLVPIDERDLIFSVDRARARGAAALLADVPVPRAHPGLPSAVVFNGIDPTRLAKILASPLLALLPRKFNPSTPDATGAFRAEPSSSRLVLTRNMNAARGPSFLEAVEVNHATDLRTSLRSFESERDDVGWLGMGLHAGRKGAVKFDLGRVAWVVLTTGPDAGSFGVPGAAHRLVDALPAERLAHLGLGPLPKATGDPAWGGPATELVVDEGASHLVEVAQSIGPILSSPGHEITVQPLSRGEITKRRARGKVTLGLDVVRPLGSSALQTLLALATADDVVLARDLARRPPKLAPGALPRALTSALRLGVIGEIRIAGGVVPDLTLARSSLEGWDLGASFRKGRK